MGGPTAEQLAEEVAKLFGRRIVIVETEGIGAPEFNGFVNSSPELSGYIFIHKGSVRPHLLTVGHELWHHISLSAPSMARTVRTVREQKIAEEHGVRERMSMEELNAQLPGEARVGLETNAMLSVLGMGVGKARRIVAGEELSGDLRSSLSGAGSEERGKYAETDGKARFDPSDEADVRFSKKGTRPHRLAKPIELNYKTYDERLKDPAYVLEDILRGSDGADRPERGKHGRELASGARLRTWAEDHGKIFSADSKIFSALQGGGGEHSVVFDETSGRLVKVTKPGLFGAQAEDAGAYLERQALSNRVLGDDVRVEGIVTLPGEDEPRLVTSQSFVKGRDASSVRPGTSVTLKPGT